MILRNIPFCKFNCLAIYIRYNPKDDLRKRSPCNLRLRHAKDAQGQSDWVTCGDVRLSQLPSPLATTSSFNSPTTMYSSAARRLATSGTVASSTRRGISVQVCHSGTKKLRVPDAPPKIDSPFSMDRQRQSKLEISRFNNIQNS